MPICKQTKNSEVANVTSMPGLQGEENINANFLVHMIELTRPGWHGKNTVRRLNVDDTVRQATTAMFMNKRRQISIIFSIRLYGGSEKN